MDACTVTHRPLHCNGSDEAGVEGTSHHSRERWQRLAIVAALITAATGLITALTNLLIWLL
jgi:hypothetical protein